MSSTGTPPRLPSPPLPELRVAIAGAGMMARHHARAIPRSGIPARVVAVAEPDAGARRAMQEIRPGAEGFDSLTDLLAAMQPDVVHVCTPPATHERLARAALEAGCHVYVEKPFAETRKGAARILDLAEERRLRVSAGHQLLFEAPMRRAVQLLPTAGVVEHVESYFSFRPTRTRGARPLRDEEQLLDVLPHPVYALLHLLERCQPAQATQMLACELGPGGTLHALLQRGPLTSTLVVSLEARPVESYLRVVGRQGTIHADFVRGTVQHAIGPGSSFVDKTLNPFRQARQLAFGTTGALAARALRRQASYPGLAEAFEAFYRAIREGGEPPVSADNILETTSVCERVRELLAQARLPQAAPAPTPRVAISGGTGFLGVELVRSLRERGAGVRVLARRAPPPWRRVAGVEYLEADLGDSLPREALAGIETVVHLAAETGGDFEAHRRNSVGAAEGLLRAAAAAGVRRFIHVSSLAVHAGGGGEAVREETGLEPEAEVRGPYVWGKVESERLVGRLGAELGLITTIVRPGPIVDLRQLEPPGRLGRRVGNLFVAVGPAREPFAVVERGFAARALAWLVEHPDESPAALNLLSPTLPTRRELVNQLRRANPGLRAVWLPRRVLRLLSALGVGAQRLLRRGRPPVDLARVFAGERYDTSAVAALAARIDEVPDPSVEGRRQAALP